MIEKEPPVIRSSGFVSIDRVLEAVSQAEDKKWDDLQNLKRMMEDEPTQFDVQAEPTAER